jgi:uncharacterized protein YecT (DUF1311 family)
MRKTVSVAYRISSQPVMLWLTARERSSMKTGLTKVSTFGASMFLCFSIALSGSGLEQKKQDPCANAKSTAEMRDCVGRQYKTADDELNRVYRQLMSKLDDEGHKAALKTAQQAWIKYRDANCDFESYLSRGGTMEPVSHYGCLTWMTAARTKELREALSH